MKFVLTAGGTAGHINPAIALAQELQSRGHEVRFAGTPDHLEAKLVPQSGFEFKAFEASGFNRRRPLTLFTAINSINQSTKAAKLWLSKENPDAVIGFGCYVSLAICRAAKMLNVPFLIHEQNSVMGLANKYLSKHANVTCLTYKHAKIDRCKKVEITGNPVRKDFLKIGQQEGRKFLDIPQQAKFLVCFGGSLGAARINSAMICMANDLLEKYPDLYIMHITGQKLFEGVQSRLHINESFAERYRLIPYQEHMAQTISAADVCICRAGASSLAEIMAACKPSILVPYPYATGNHQYYNAKSLIDENAALCVLDSEVESDKFVNAVDTLVGNDDIRCGIIEQLQKFEGAHATDKLADIVENEVRDNG